MEMPRPTAAHKQLEALIGSWNGDEKLFPSPWDPKGGTAIGRTRNRPAVDGFAVVQEYEQELHGSVNFRGHGVFSYDGSQQCYVLHWWDSMGMPASEFRGNFSGKVLTLTGKGSTGMGRVTYDLSREGILHFSLESSQDGKQWMKMMEGTYRRSQ